MRHAALFAMLVCASAASALAPRTSLGGKVTSADKPLANVSVTVTSPLLQQPRVTSTNADGRYWVPALAPGEYDVTFSLPKHQTITKRAILRTGEQGRTDAQLEPSEEEEAVTSTAAHRMLLEEPRAVFSLDGETLNLLPIARSIRGSEVDEIAERVDVPLDALRELAIPIGGRRGQGAGGRRDLSSCALRPAPCALITNDATNSLAATLRFTYDSEHDDIGEITAGGAAIPDRLWLYGYGLSRDGSTSGHARVTGSPTSRDTISVFAFDQPGASWLHSGVRFNAFAAASDDEIDARASLYLGGHELTAGYDDEAFFARDRWAASDYLIVEGQLRVDDGDAKPRLGAVYDLHHDGRRRIGAWWDDDEQALSFAQQFLSGGHARATFLRGDDTTELVADASYHYLLFTLGGLASFSHTSGNWRNTATAWILADPPFLEHDVTLALLGRYRAGGTALDLAVRYSLSKTRFVPFVKGEVINLFGREPESRSYRLGLGARI